MERSAELDWIRRYLTHLEAGTTQLRDAPRPLSASVYTDDARLAAETALERRLAAPVALSCDLPDAGSCLATRVGGVPLLLMRHGDGRVRAFVNGCRHRGRPLVDDRCRAPGGHLRCPFHGWTYATDGRLRSIPQAAGGFDSPSPDMGLHERPCIESEGLVLVRAEGDAPIDAEAALEGVRSDLSALDLGSCHHYETRTTHWACNWKLLLDTFLESYHVFSLHRESVHPWYFSHPMLCDAWGPNLRFVVARRSIESLRERPESDWHLADHATLQWLLGPSHLLTATRDEVLLWHFASPLPGRVDVRTSYYTRTQPRDDADRSRLAAAFDLQLRVAGEEDFPNQERIQTVLGSGALPELVLGRNEVATAHFHDTLDRLLDA